MQPSHAASSRRAEHFIAGWRRCAGSILAFYDMLHWRAPPRYFAVSSRFFHRWWKLFLLYLVVLIAYCYYWRVVRPAWRTYIQPIASYRLHQPLQEDCSSDHPHLQGSWRRNLLQPVDPGCVPQLKASAAFIHPQRPLQIRVMLVGDVNVTQRLFCHLILDNTNVASVNASRPQHAIFEWNKHKVNYDAFFVECPTRIWAYYSVITHVSISCSALALGSSLTPIYTIPPDAPASASLGACVGPLHGHINPTNLIAWIEMNRLLGVSSFIFYNHSGPSHLEPIFRYYASQGVTALFQWRPDPEIPTRATGGWPPLADSLHYFGQFPMINECLLRLTHRVRYILFCDLDELLLPLHFNQISELVHSKDTTTTAGFSFPMTYLRSDFPTESMTRSHPLVRVSRVLFLQRTWREDRVFPHDTGPKMVVKAGAVDRMGVHDVIDTRTGNVTYLTPDEGLLLHYRDPPSYLVNASVPGHHEERLLFYMNDLLRNTELTISRVQQYRRSWRGKE